MENGIRPPIQMAVDSMRNLRLGNQGEQNAQLIRIDVSKWLEKWPGAGIDLMLALPGEKASYPAKTFLQDGELLFLPGFGDTQKAGHGVAYVVATLNGTHVAVSDTVLTEILPKGRDGDTLPEAPEAQAGWVADVLNAATRAEEAAERAENAQVTDEQIGKAVEDYLQENPIEVPAYELPTASADTLGGVKVGPGMRMYGDALGVKPEGKWEIIETLVLPEATNKIVRTVYPDGGNYNLLSAKITAKFYYPIDQKVGTRVDVYSGGNNILQMVQSVEQHNGAGYTIGTAGTTVMYQAKPVAGVYEPIVAMGTQGGAMNVYYPPNGSYQTAESTKRITRIDIVAWSGIIPAGTTIEIWGVRADA